MAIGHVVTRGFGNGSLVGTIGLVVRRGYASAAAGPEDRVWCLAAGQVFCPGLADGIAGEVFSPGADAGQVYTDGPIAGQVGCC